MSPERIIIVADDDEDIRETMASVLRDEGYETRTARDGREALLVLEALGDAPCVLVLDLMMPRMSGFEVLDILASTRRLADLPVIVCSAATPSPSLPTGIRQFVSKPIALDALLADLRSLCADEPPPRRVAAR